MFSFLFAGHGKYLSPLSCLSECSHPDIETTAHTLAATLAFLALDHGLQDELVAQVREATRGREDDTLVSALTILSFH